ncbi:PREDICTED: T-cell surface glycoprotein CD5 [Elephantulus edwardii]|uniref:T-cell surface glycoprotein CD5 n=1 Tax=Elephantulus edwardii TaxID=28737 RepID=UPI0003F07ABD|nr:PREDICTED: T-cell surface glycoprotein CD5 [Elephantulus edwardii]
MESQQLPLASAYLLGVLEIQVKLSNSNSRCQGQLEVRYHGAWSTVCKHSWDQQEHSQQPTTFCQQLGCGALLRLDTFSPFNKPHRPLICHGPPWSISNCSISSISQCQPLGLICLEPPTTRPPTTSPPPTTTPKPTVPPRLQLVAGPAGLRCAGVVEFYRGSQGGTISSNTPDLTQGLGNLICGALQCGSFLDRLPEPSAAGDTSRGYLPLRWTILNTNCTSLEQCFQSFQPEDSDRPLAVLCSGFQPKVQSRLVGDGGVCEGIVEVRQGGRWAALCDSPLSRNTKRWEEVCQEQQCGSFKTYWELGADEKTPKGLTCSYQKLSQCPTLQEKTHCKRVFVTCQNPHPSGLGTGTVMSIILALVLLVVLLVVCGPLAYKKLVKKFRQKKQRQWIGPTGMNQNMSFHRNHTATVRSQVETPAASHVDNEYSQPPRSSYLSAYPALEGALHRSSAQPDNSSDSDYDLNGTQRL